MDTRFEISYSNDKVIYIDNFDDNNASMYLDAIKLNGYEPLAIIFAECNCSGETAYSIITNTNQYFECMCGEIRQFELPVPDNNKSGTTNLVKPVYSWPSVFADCAVVELSDGRYMLVGCKEEIEEEEWITVDDITHCVPKDGSILLGFTWEFCVAASRDCITLSYYTPHESAVSSRKFQIEYRMITVGKRIFVVRGNEVGDLSNIDDLADENCMNEVTWVRLPACMDGFLPTGFGETEKFGNRLVVYGSAVFSRDYQTSFVFAYNLPENAVRFRNEFVLCADGNIYCLRSDGYEPVTRKE